MRRARSRIRIRHIIIAILLIGIFSVGALATWGMVVAIPAINSFENRRVAESTKIYDRTGNVVLFDVHGAMRRTAVPLSEVSLYAQSAAIAIEDASFYEHNGFRPLALLRAILVNLRLMPGIVGQGGSTITQQVVKNTLLTQDKTVIRKAKEVVLALRLERIYTKEQILETYLNETAYGGTVYGIQEASQYFFGVDAKDLTLAQSAYLAALPQAPTRYSPYGNHRDLLEGRKNLVLAKMREHELISEEEYGNAKAEVVEFRDSAEAGIKAPHFVFYVREYLEETYGADAVANGGFRVVTTLDWDLQKKAEEVIGKRALENEENFNASNAGLVAIDPKTGGILAMVGSRGYFDENIDGKVNITLAHRQPGSSFKPFVYATAFEKGYTPDTVVFDLKTQFSSLCSPTDIANDEPPCYSPENYDGTFKGPVTLRNALAQSINIPAVKVVYLAGIDNSIHTAERMGITTLADAERYGLTLVLGGGEVTLLELTGAYAAFANDGVRNPPVGILRVEDSSRRLLEEYEQREARALDPQIARQINDVLSDNIARTPEFGADSPLHFSSADVADKTGTTNDFRDTWIVGYTPGVAVGAWAGNNDNSPMVKKIAAFIVAPLWHEVMEYAIERYPADTFVPPAPDPDYDALPPVLRGVWNSEPSEGVHDILHWVEKGNPRGGKPFFALGDAQYARWEYPVSLWVAENPALVKEPGAAESVSGSITILSPLHGSRVPLNTPIAATARAPDGTTRVLYYVNGAYAGASNLPPYAVSILPNARGVVEVRAVAERPGAASLEHTIQVSVL
jgi:1A family penicillin-binding protein